MDPRWREGGNGVEQQKQSQEQHEGKRLNVDRGLTKEAVKKRVDEQPLEGYKEEEPEGAGGGDAQPMSDEPSREVPGRHSTVRHRHARVDDARKQVDGGGKDGEEQQQRGRLGEKQS